MTKNDFSLQVQMQAETGQILALRDPEADMDLVRYAPGPELELNGVPLVTRLVKTAEGKGEHIAYLEARLNAAYGAGATLRFRRVMTRGGYHLHTGKPGSLHIRYEMCRVPHTDPGEGLDYIWQPEIEAPLRLDTLTVLGAPALWFGKDTRMRAIAIGGSGPREHVSLEDGPVADVVPHLQTGFRTVFPGQQTVNGALYYHPGDERFVWVIVRRPTTAGRILFGGQRQAFRFDYFTDVKLQDEWTTPAVSLFWGKGLTQADRVLAEQFDRFEEPPPWWYNTSWFWMHPGWQQGRSSFDAMGRGAEILMDECGVNGFGLFHHDVPWSGNDCDPGSPQPSPGLGGDAALRRAVERIRNKGGHTYSWISRHGHRSETAGWRDSWGIKGIDGRNVRLHNPPDGGVRLDIINCADPSFQSYIMGWIEYYVKHLGITGLFWDSGLQALPPDFGNKPYMRWPGETAALPLEFYERIYRYGRSLSPDFFMWVEGISTDAPMNAFAVDNRGPLASAGHALMRRLAHLGPKRLVWRSAWPHDLASAFPFIAPTNDIGHDPSEESYRKIAADPMNRWICKIVRERGVRQAVGLADGISLLDEFVVASPGVSGAVTVPAALCRGNTLTQVITGTRVSGRSTGAGTHFELPESGAYRM